MSSSAANVAAKPLFFTVTRVIPGMGFIPSFETALRLFFSDLSRDFPQVKGPFWLLLFHILYSHVMLKG